MRTYQPRLKEIKREWHLIDAKGQILGRLATEAAMFLIGKHKSNYSQHEDMGDYVVVLNAEKIQLSGKKKEQKRYFRHSGYPGGFKEIKFSKLFSDQPKKAIEHAVSGMIPDNRLKKWRMKRLKIIVGGENPYEDKFKNKEQSA